MKIKMLQTVGAYPLGATINVEDRVGESYVTARLAERIAGDGAATLDNLAETIKKAVAQGFTTGVEAVQARNAPGNPSRVRIDVGEQEADRTRCLADQVKQIVIAGCPMLYPGQQGAAVERLEKVYGSKWVQGSEKKDLAEGSGTTGGYTVAPLYANELLKLAAEESIVRPYANVKKLPAREAYYPMLNQTFTPAGTQGAPQSAYYGGVQMQWTGEAQPRAQISEPNFKQVHVVTHELAGLAKISRTLMSDSMLSMEAELKSLFAAAIAFAEDYAFLLGDGNAKPKGAVNGPATITYASRATPNQFKLADAANMMGVMLPQCRPRSVWVMINNMFSTLVQLQDASGRVTYLPQVGTGYGVANVAAGQTGLLLFGRPVIFTERLNTLGTAGDVLLADFSKYIVADTGTLEIAASDQYAFNTNQITFRIIQRVDGQQQLDAPITQLDGVTQISPWVILHA